MKAKLGRNHFHNFTTNWFVCGHDQQQIVGGFVEYSGLNVIVTDDDDDDYCWGVSEGVAMYERISTSAVHFD